MPKELAELQYVWDQHAKADPLWAILSDSDKKGRKWNLEEFLLTGEQDIAHVLKVIEESGPAMARGIAVDFGCGVGRLTQPLAARFDLAIGIDISPTMIDAAALINRYGNKAQYILNSVDDLSVIPNSAADLVFSHIVLQHIPPTQAKRYIREFFRIGKPGAVIVFQIPSHLSDEYLPSDYTEDPLPREACKVAIRLGDPIKAITAGSKLSLKVRVRNISQCEWKQARVHQLNLANRWRSRDSRGLFIADDGRSRLPGRVQAGEEVELQLEISAPLAAGKYHLELDVVQEGVRWFQDAGSKVAQFEAEVIADVDNRPTMSHAVEQDRSGAAMNAESKITPPPFEMHGIRKQEILSLIEEYRANLFSIEEHLDEWYSYRYYVQSALSLG